MLELILVQKTVSIYVSAAWHTAQVVLSGIRYMKSSESQLQNVVNRLYCETVVTSAVCNQ